MVMMNLLRMLVDVSFYGAFAGLVARACGGNGAYVGMLLQCACFALSRLGGRKRVLRLLWMLPTAFGWIIYRHSPADCVFLIPTAAYMIRLVWKADYALDPERQQSLFSVFWKALAAIIPFGLLLGGADALSAVTAPYAMVMLVCSVLLMRALRHEPKVYCGARYQITNLSTAAVVVGTAGLLSTNTFLNGCKAALGFLYDTLARPVLEWILELFLFLFQLIAGLFSRLSFLGGERDEEKEILQMDLRGNKELFGEEFWLAESAELLRILGIAVLILVAAVVLSFFFRWLTRSRPDENVAAAREEREMVGTDRRPAKKKETTPVKKIRAQYRSLLKWCAERDLAIGKSSTTLDVHRQIGVTREQSVLSGQIRELYIKARYADKAERDDVRQMKRLCEELKRPEDG